MQIALFSMKMIGGAQTTEEVFKWPNTEPELSV